MRRIFLTTSFLIIHYALFGQNLTDSILKLNEVVVRAYFTAQPLFQSPSSAFVIDDRQLKQQVGNSLVPAMNIVPGVRMEERSPGSYRLSIRGSLLRSPFGVRNVKVYMDEFPLTDASGNTYINFLDMNSITGVEVLKGPDGSLFGANSGGVVLFKLFEEHHDETSNSADISGGSYGLFHEYLATNIHEKKYHIKISQGYQRIDGYRAQSSMRRNILQTEQKWSYSSKNELKALLLYSDYDYETPGGLTLTQMENNPRAARYPTPITPGAIEQHASVRNQILSGGLSHEVRFNKELRHLISVFGSHVNFGNISIANIEDKTEDNLGFRTYLELSGKKKSQMEWQLHAGMEFQQTHAKISNYGNVNGIHDSLQAADRLYVQQYFFFTRFFVNVFNRLNLEAAISLNNFQYKFGPLQSDLELTTRTFIPQLMPKLALSCRITNNLVGKVSVSRGFSPPTIDEIRSSDNTVNTDLQPENGWNFETGLRFREKNNRYWLEALLFNYQLEDAIVRRMNPDNTEYFVNVGGTKQLGLEATLNLWIIEPRNHSFIRELQLRNSYTLSKFTFINYLKANNDYSGNKLTGVPEQVFISSISLTLPGGIYFFLQYNYTSRIPLNDENSVFSKDYNLIQLKAGWQVKKLTKYNLEFYAGVDNLLNEEYSLGNDLNAVGGRYYNPSPIRNFFGGIKLKF